METAAKANKELKETQKDASIEEVKDEPAQQEKIEAKPIPKPSEPLKVIDVDKTISTYNGAKTDKYNWSQSIKNVDVQVPLPKGTTSRQIIVEIKTKHLKVLIKGQSTPIIDGELCERVKVEDSFWSIEDAQFLNLNFEKASEVIWKQVIVGDAEIDTKTVDNSKHLDEFDNET